MSVVALIESRYSCRDFDPSKHVDLNLIHDLLKISSRSASGGNLQPWRVAVVSGEFKKSLEDDVISVFTGQNNDSTSSSSSSSKSYPKIEQGLPDYEIYPPDDKLRNVYKDRRKKVAQQLYAYRNIQRSEKDKRLKEVARNFQFFDAPVGLFVLIEKSMGYPQWSDLGMFLNSFGLLCAENGLATCFQEIWALFGKSIRERLIKSPDSDNSNNLKADDYILFCGVSVGYAKSELKDKPPFKTERAPLEDFVSWHGGAPRSDSGGTEMAISNLQKNSPKNMLGSDWSANSESRSMKLSKL